MNNTMNNIDFNTNNFNANEILLYNILLSTNNYINSSNNTINYLNNSIYYLNNSINHLNTNANNSLLLLLNNYNCYNNYLNANNASNASNANSNSNSPNAYLLNYTLEDFENLSNVNMRALVKISTAKINYCCIAVPLNDTCPITQEEFTNNDEVTIIKNCGHIFKTCAINNWLFEHQTCPVCRHNILTNSNIISYINPYNNKRLFLYSNEFRFYLALHIESLLTNRDSSENEDSDFNNNSNNNNNNTRSEQNSYEFGLFLR
jgi:hypothetical protein